MMAFIGTRSGVNTQARILAPSGVNTPEAKTAANPVMARVQVFTFGPKSRCERLFTLHTPPFKGGVNVNGEGGERHSLARGTAKQPETPAGGDVKTMQHIPAEEVDPDRPRRSWRIRHADGWASHTFNPPATLAQVWGWYPRSLDIQPEHEPDEGRR